MKTVTIFGSSRPKSGEPDYEVARQLGKLLAEAGFTVCNGGYGGTMEASARGAKEGGGKTIGVTVNVFQSHTNQWIDEEIRMPRLTDRLMKLVELGEAYVVLKGGTGTLLELAYVWEFMNKGLMREKPVAVLGTFWTPVIKTLGQELLQEGLGDHTRLIREVPNPEACLIFLKQRLFASTHYESKK
jgi:uncharacterized protein (TIGR00730 family)